MRDARVHRGPYEATNGGISSTECTIYILAPGETNPNVTRPEVLFREELRGRDYYAAIPVAQRPGMVGPMFGGNMAITHDTGPKREYHIHDRWETPESYAELSQ